MRKEVLKSNCLQIRKLLCSSSNLVRDEYQLFLLCPKPQQSRGSKNDVSQTLPVAAGNQ